MLYVDGELDGERGAVVRAYLDRDASARSKVAALRLASSLVCEQALDSAIPADDIAGGVMAKIAAGAVKMEPAPLDEPEAKRALDEVRRERPANDNSRSILVLTAIAVAAAAGMMIWGRSATPPGPVAQNEPVSIEATAPRSALPPTIVPEPGLVAEDEPGVEIAAVDFGARVGTIFYVSNGVAAPSATTAVVWLNDDDAGGEK